MALRDDILKELKVLNQVGKYTADLVKTGTDGKPYIIIGTVKLNDTAAPYWKTAKDYWSGKPPAGKLPKNLASNVFKWVPVWGNTELINIWMANAKTKGISSLAIPPDFALAGNLSATAVKAIKQTVFQITVNGAKRFVKIDGWVNLASVTCVSGEHFMKELPKVKAAQAQADELALTISRLKNNILKIKTYAAVLKQMEPVFWEVAGKNLYNAILTIENAANNYLARLQKEEYVMVSVTEKKNAVNGTGIGLAPAVWVVIYIVSGIAALGGVAALWHYIDRQADLKQFKQADENIASAATAMEAIYGKLNNGEITPEQAAQLIKVQQDRVQTNQTAAENATKDKPGLLSEAKSILMWGIGGLLAFKLLSMAGNKN